MSSRGVRAVMVGAVGGLLTLVATRPALARLAPEAMGIADVAPKNTLIIAGTDDWTKMAAAFARTSINAIGTDPQFKVMWTALWDSVDEVDKDDPSSFGKLFPLGGVLKDAGIEPDELPWPTGSAGIAVFELPRAEAKEPARDPENFADWQPPAQTPPGVLISSDFGPKAADVEAFAEKAMAQLVKRDEATVATAEHAGATIHTLTLTKLEARWKESLEEQAKVIEEAFRKRAKGNADAGDADWNPAQYIRRQPLPAQLRMVQTLHLARKDSVVLVSNHREAIEQALDTIEAQRAGPVATRPSYVGARKALGDGVNAFAIVLIDAYAQQQADARKAKPDEMGDEGGLFPGGSVMFLSILGVKGTTALAGSVTFDTPAGTAEVRVLHQIPKVTGLLALLDKAPGGFEPPAFAPVDAMSVGTMYVRFDKVVEKARETLKALPAGQQPIDEQSFQQFEALAAPVLASMGPRVHILSTLERPLAHDSAHGLYAIELRDPAPVRSILVAFGGQMGLKPRDFEGHQIFASTEEMIPAIGLGFGYAFLGPVKDVENAMRQSARPDAAIASRKDFRAATASLRPNGTAYVYQDLRSAVELAIWTLQHPAAARDFDADEAEGGNKQPRTAPAPPAWVAKIPPIDTWMKYLGDTVWELQQTDGGFELRQTLLRTAADR